MEHFMNPKNVGVIENPDGYGKVGNPVCGDLMEIFIKVKDDRIDEIKFRTFGCGSAIAEGPEFDFINPVILDLDKYLHEIAADRVAHFTVAVRVLDHPHILG